MKRLRASSTTCAMAAAMFGGMLLSGCSSFTLPRMPWQKMPLDASAGFYDSASIVYRIDASKLQQPLDVARFEGQRVTFEQVASSPLGDHSTGSLSIAYPHPGGKAGWAQARFAIDSTPPKASAPRSWNPFKKASSAAKPTAVLAAPENEVHELWVLDIPKAESDHYLAVLNAQSFYNSERADAQGTEITVAINGKQVRKNWSQIAEFNALAQRVRRDGRLASYSRPAVLQGDGVAQFTSTVAYRQMLSQTAMPGAQAAASALAASPFAMPPAVPGAAVAATQGPAAAVR